MYTVQGCTSAVRSFPELTILYLRSYWWGSQRKFQRPPLNAALIATYGVLWFVAVGVPVSYPMLAPHWLCKVVHLCLFLLRLQQWGCVLVRAVLVSLTLWCWSWWLLCLLLRSWTRTDMWAQWVWVMQRASIELKVQRSTPQSSCLVSFLLSLPPSLPSSPSLIYFEIDLP